MAFETRQRGYDVSVGRSAAEIDAGLRAYMLSVYNYMASALALTGVVAMAVSTSPTLMQAIFGTGLQWIVMLAPIGLVFFLSARIHKMSFGAAQTTFWIYAALMGLSLSSIFLVYTGESIARTFFITAGTFGAMSLFGYGLGQLPVHGSDRHHHCHGGQHLPREHDVAVHHLGCWCTDLHGPYRL